NDDHDATCLALAKLGLKPDRKEVERRFQELYLGTRKTPGLWRREKWLFPLKALEQLARQFPLGIVTGRTREEARMALKAGKAARFFKAVITTDDVKKKKPEPDAVRAAMRKLGAKTAWMVGDGPADLLAARRAGIPSVAVRGPDLSDRREAVLR